jgi:hypothetical protein
MCEFTQGIRGSYQNAGVMCSVVTYKSPVDRKKYDTVEHRIITLHVKCVPYNTRPYGSEISEILDCLR